jgi:phosphatidylserine/phosphatidylglycerophosphate/cardiolipin synthase-like enzyme
MPFLENLFIATEQHLGGRIGPVVAPLLHRRHQRALHDGAVDEEQARHARDSWWGHDPRWFPGGTPPRQRNRITPLIDGEAYFSRLYKALTGARHYVYIAGWCLTPHIPLLRGTQEDLIRTRLVDVLAQTAERIPVRVLLWGGAPAIIQPTRSAVRETQRILREGIRGNLVCALDETAQMTHCHHQKAIVVDGHMAFVGGMDLTTFAGDRWDCDGHDLRAGVNWHDVEVEIEGEAVADVERNFRERWTAVTGESSLPHLDPAQDGSWSTPAQIVRTIPRGRYAFAPKGEFGIHHVYVEAIRRAREYIYIETQYLWSPEIMEALTDAMNSERDSPFRIVIVLPARATSGRWDNDRHVESLRKADRGRGIAEVYSLYASGPAQGVRPFRYRPTYVHAKVAIIDDEWLTVGSANLNTRGLVTDSEINMVAQDAVLSRALREQLWAGHLGLTSEEATGQAPIELIDKQWRQKAAENSRIIQEGELPLSSQVHRYECGRVPGNWLLEESEGLTFEH